MTHRPDGVRSAAGRGDADDRIVAGDGERRQIGGPGRGVVLGRFP